MRQWPIALAFCVLLPALTWAQRGGRASGGTLSRGGFAGRGPAVGVSRGLASFAGSHFSGSSRFGGRVNVGVRPPFIYSNRFYRRRPYGYSGIYPYLGAYYVNPGYYADYDYPPQDAGYAPAMAPGYNTPAPYFDQDAQYRQDQIDRLEAEVAQLREQRVAQSNPAPAPPQPATELVFQDRHKEEVQNYAIVGETLWIFTQERARKFPVSDLDIAATQKANDDRGVDFRLPN